MKYMLMIHQGTTPLPGTPEWDSLSESERQAVYLFFEADDLDAAIELASRIPASRLGGAIEVRPLKE